MNRDELIDLIIQMSHYIGYASCAGNKCRLPHCTDCNDRDDIDWDALEEVESKARTVYKLYRAAP